MFAAGTDLVELDEWTLNIRPRKVASLQALNFLAPAGDL